MRYYERYIAIAKAAGARVHSGNSPTWRASADWGWQTRLFAGIIATVNRNTIALMCKLSAIHATSTTPIIISGCVGPRGDGYDPGHVVSAKEAQAYHAHQIGAFVEAGADMTTAITMTNANESIGIARAARAAGLPVGFVYAGDGWLPADRPDAPRCCSRG